MPDRVILLVFAPLAGALLMIAAELVSMWMDERRFRRARARLIRLHADVAERAETRVFGVDAEIEEWSDVVDLPPVRGSSGWRR